MHQMDQQINHHRVITERPGKNLSYKVLGVRVDAVQIPDVVNQIECWIGERRRSHYIAVTGMHGVSEAQEDRSFKTILNSADLVVPDGTPLVWLGRLHGFSLKRRVYGPELMLAFFGQPSCRRYRHFFYGGTPGLAEELAKTLCARFPGSQVVGTYSPPFRLLTAEEKREVVELINRTRPDVVWVGLSTPKQERWMHEYRGEIQVPVMVGVGAAFDLNSGSKKQAPVWMREHGLEWFFRLLHEPRRLWRRYLVHGPRFVTNAILEVLGLKTFE